MKHLKNLFASISLIAILLVGSNAVKAGLIISDFTESKSQTKLCDETNNKSKLDWGIVITGFTGIVITGFTGIVITGAVEEPIECGIIVND